MATSYWPDASSAASANASNAVYASPDASNNIHMNPCSTYGIQPGTANSYGGYPGQGNAQGQPAYHRVQHDIRASNDTRTTNLPVAVPTSSSSSLQDALRLRIHQTSLSPFSSGSSGSSSLSVSLSQIPSINPANNRGNASSLSPLSPFAPPRSHNATVDSGMNRVESQSHIESQQTYVHSHRYTGTSYSPPKAAFTDANVGPIPPIPGYVGSGNVPVKFDVDMNAELYTFDSPDPSLEPELQSGYEPISASFHARSGPSGSPARSDPHLRAFARQGEQPNTHAHTRSIYACASTRTSQGSSSSQAQQYSSVWLETHVKTEPDVEESRSLQRSPEPPAGAGVARFVMEHPYPYTYASQRGRGCERSTSPVSPISERLSQCSSNNPRESLDEEPGHSSSNTVIGQAVQPTPHSLTAPLRAVNASKEMRACMGVFRLDPFTQLNGIALRCGFIPDETACTGKNRKKRKSKGRAKKREGTKMRDSIFSDGEEDEIDESEEEEESTDDTLTWDGRPPGPLTEEPVLIEFQLYFEGMEVEDDIDADRRRNERDRELEEFFDETVRARPYSTAELDPRGRDKGADVSRSSRVIENARANRYDHGADATGRELSHKAESENQKSRIAQHDHIALPRPQGQISARHSRLSGVFQEYLDLDFGIDDMEAEMDGWASGEESPLTPYAQTNNTGNCAFVQTYKTSSTSVYLNTPNGGVNASGSVSTREANRLTPAILGSSSGFANATDYNGERARYFDSSGYMRVADSNQPTSSSSVGQSNFSPRIQTNSNSNAILNSGSSHSLNLASAGTRINDGNATLQQLRTQAALRAVSAHSQTTQGPVLYRGVPEPGNVQRLGGTGAGAGGTVNFTPTPASVAAQMHTGLLSSGRAHQQHQYPQHHNQEQHYQQQNRMRASSVAHPLQGQGQGQGQGQSQVQNPPGSGIGHASGVAHSSYSSGYAYTNYAPEVEDSDADLVSRSTSLSGALGHGGPTVQTLERRWGDVLQRVHG